MRSPLSVTAVFAFRPLVARLAWAAPLLLAALACAAACLARPQFQTNDDAALAMLGAGFGLALQPEPILLFAHPGYGLLLNVLSRVVGPTAHGWVTLAAVSGSLAVLLQQLWRRGSGAAEALLGIGCAGLVYTIALLSPQFTITSAAMFSAGMLLALRATGIASLAAACVWLVLSFLVRAESYLLGCCVCGPALICLAIGSDCARQARFVVVIVAGIAAAGVVTGWLGTHAAPGWAAASRYNALRAQFIDFGRVPWTAGAEAYRAAHWSQNDYDIFRDWYCLDPIYDAPVLRRIIDAVALPVSSRWDADFTAWAVYLLRTPGSALTLASEAGVLLLLARARLGAGLLVVVGQVGACAVLALTGREPLLRVGIAMADIGLLMMVGLLIGSAPSPVNRTMAAARLGAALLIAALGGRLAAGAIQDHRADVAYADTYRAWVASQAAEFRHPTVVWGASLHWEMLITPIRTYPPFPDWTVAGLGGLTNAPVQARVREALGMARFSRAVCTDTSVRIVADVRSIELLSRFCQEHEHVAAAFAAASRNGPDAIYRLAAVP